MDIKLNNVDSVKYRNLNINAIKLNGEEVWRLGTTVNGEPPLTLSNSTGVNLRKYILYGNSTQDGTPTPDSPVDIQSVGDLVTDETSEYYGKYDIPIIVRGINLFKPQTETSNIEQQYGNISISPLRDGALSITGTPMPGYYNYISFCNPCDFTYGAGSCTQVNDVIVPKGNNFIISWEHISGDTSFGYIVLTDSNGDYHGMIVNYSIGYKNISALDYDVCNIYLRFPHGSEGYTFNDVYRFQVTLGTEVLPFEPYKEQQTAHIYLDEPLRAIGDYRDYIDYRNNKVVRNIRHLELKSSYAWTDRYNRLYFNLGTPSLYVASNGKVVQLATNYSPAVSGWFGTTNTTGNTIGFSKSSGNWSFTTLDEMKAWLDTHDMYVDYPLATPIEEPIDNLPVIGTNEGTNTIMTGTTIQPSNMSVTYIKTKG